MQKQGNQTYNGEEENVITYGDVFKFSGELAREPITPMDAAIMQSAEARAIGRASKGGAAAVMEAAAVMQAAADANERGGLVGRTRATLATNEDMTVTKTVLPGYEDAAGHPVHSEFEPAPTEHPNAASDAITIGQALHAAAMERGDEPIDENDARAVQSAEKRATGFPAEKGGLAATAQSAAELNPRVDDVGKTTISNVLMGACVDLPTDKAVTTEDAEKIMEAECRGGSEGHPRPGGIGEAMRGAANLNEQMGAPLALPSDAVEEEDLMGRRLRGQAEGVKEVSSNT